MKSSEVIIEKLAAMSKEAAYGMETAKKGYKAVKGGVSRAYKGYVSALKGKGIKATGQNLKNVEMAADYGALAGNQVERYGKAYKAYAKEKLKTLAARGATGVAGAGVVGAGALAINHKNAPVEKSAFVRLIGPQRERNKDVAVYHSKNRDAFRSMRKGTSQRVGKSPIGSYLFGNAMRDTTSSIVGEAASTIRARKAAYKSKNPVKSYIPFSGWGRKGEESLQEILAQRAQKQ